MKFRSFVYVCLLAGQGCADPASGPAPLRVAAASDLQAVLPRLIAAFTAETGIAVAPPTFGASGQLAEQVRQGAPFDVFLAANEEYVQALAEDGTIIADTVVVYARGRLVLVVDPGREEVVARLDDLNDPKVRRVAIANPEFAPYGKVARAALEKAGLTSALGPKLVRAESVRQALQFVQTGDADAGLVGQSIARASGLKTIELDELIAPPVPQALGILTTSRRPNEARAFTRFVLNEGRSLLMGHGFDVP